MTFLFSKYNCSSSVCVTHMLTSDCDFLLRTINSAAAVGTYVRNFNFDGAKRVRIEGPISSCPEAPTGVYCADYHNNAHKLTTVDKYSAVCRNPAARFGSHL